MAIDQTDGQNWIEATLIPGVFWTLVILLLLVFLSLSAFFVLIDLLVPLVNSIEGTGEK